MNAKNSFAPVSEIDPETFNNLPPGVDFMVSRLTFPQALAKIISNNKAQAAHADHASSHNPACSVEDAQAFCKHY